MALTENAVDNGGVRFHPETEVRGIRVERGGEVKGVETNRGASLRPMWS